MERFIVNVSGKYLENKLIFVSSGCIFLVFACHRVIKVLEKNSLKTIMMKCEKKCILNAEFPQNLDLRCELIFFDSIIFSIGSDDKFNTSRGNLVLSERMDSMFSNPIQPFEIIFDMPPTNLVTDN